jgi:ketosteroid isomerase-like protein
LRRLGISSRETLLSFLVFLVWFCGGCHAASTVPTSHACSAETARADVTRAVHEFAGAFRAGDVAKVDALLHASYVHTNSGHKAIARAAWMDWLTSRSRKIESGELKVLSYELSDIEVIVSSNVAVVTGRVDTATQVSAGTERSKIRFTNVWMCDAGQWKRIAFHDAPAAEAQ